MPFVVRVESRVINRSITRIAVLDDPAARGHRRAVRAQRRLEPLGATTSSARAAAPATTRAATPSDNVLGRRRRSAPENIAGVLVVARPPGSPRATRYVHSTLTIFGVHCNQVLSAETTMMVKEHVIEAYGPVEHVLGVGASGGALQQYTIIDGYPGLLDAGMPIISFPDVVTTAMTTVDCGLLDRDLRRRPDPLDRRQAAGRHRPRHAAAVPATGSTSSSTTSTRATAAPARSPTSCATTP